MPCRARRLSAYSPASASSLSRPVSMRWSHRQGGMRSSQYRQREVTHPARLVYYAEPEATQPRPSLVQELRSNSKAARSQTEQPSAHQRGCVPGFGQNPTVDPMSERREGGARSCEPPPFLAPSCSSSYTSGLRVNDRDPRDELDRRACFDDHTIEAFLPVWRDRQLHKGVHALGQ